MHTHFAKEVYEEKEKEIETVSEREKTSFKKVSKNCLELKKEK